MLNVLKFQPREIPIQYTIRLLVRGIQVQTFQNTKTQQQYIIPLKTRKLAVI